ncbi:hypothetical protein WDW37_16850 [Bdellovibrionota bacterium FG-1]
MAPIYDTDLATERFAKDEWSNYELWEKVEVRLRRRKRFWIGAAVVAFLSLSSVPIVTDRLPQWKALAATRRLAQEINQLKREASQHHGAFRIRFLGGGSLAYRIERTFSCSATAFEVVREGTLVTLSDLPKFVLLSPEQGANMGIRGFSESFCYDFLAGSDSVLRGETMVGFGIMPVNDVTQARSDRIAILLTAGPSGEISFE